MNCRQHAQSRLLSARVRKSAALPQRASLGIVKVCVCDITVYNVIHKCRGRVLKEEMQDGTNFFLIDALIPLVEGFQFTLLIRSKCCGIAYPQLVLDGFEVNAHNDPSIRRRR